MYLSRKLVPTKVQYSSRLRPRSRPLPTWRLRKMWVTSARGSVDCRGRTIGGTMVQDATTSGWWTMNAPWETILHRLCSPLERNSTRTFSLFTTRTSKIALITLKKWSAKGTIAPFWFAEFLIRHSSSLHQWRIGMSRFENWHLLGHLGVTWCEAVCWFVVEWRAFRVFGGKGDFKITSSAFLVAGHLACSKW